jgi:gliding motility-associated protein GldL
MSKSFFESKKWKKTMNFVYGWGAAIVIVGALFKILHLPGANEMLSVGLLTEAAIFIISSFEPVHQEPDWSLVYPELAGGEPTKKAGGSAGGSVSQQLDSLLSQAKIGPELIESLGMGLQSLSTNVKEMSSISNAAVATNEYVDATNKATQNMGGIADSSAVVSDSLGSFSSTLSNVMNNLSDSEAATAQFKSEITDLNKNLSNLNNIYGNMLSAMGGNR